MITMTEEEAFHMANRILTKMAKDKKFDKYSEGEIVAILSCAIMQIGMNISDEIHEEEQQRKAS